MIWLQAFGFHTITRLQEQAEFVRAGAAGVRACVVEGSTFRGENFNFAAADAAKPSGKGFRLSFYVRTEGFEPAVGLGANLPVAPLRAVSGVEDLGGGEGVVMSVLRLQGDSL